jgi:hypothetical protein
MAKEKKNKKVEIVIKPLNFQRAVFAIRGNSILVQNKFSKKAKDTMKETQEAGSTAKKGKKREKKDFDDDYKNSQHISSAGWNGIPASAFRHALISACKLCGYAMTRAKLTIFVVSDGFDKDDKTPLVRITKGKPKRRDDYVRIGQGKTDIHARAMFDPGWESKVTLEWDADQFTLDDVSNLMVRVGRQVGIQEGRPDSKTTGGMGWGTFDVLGKAK